MACRCDDHKAAGRNQSLCARRAESICELNLGWFAPLHGAIPEFAELDLQVEQNDAVRIPNCQKLAQKQIWTAAREHSQIVASHPLTIHNNSVLVHEKGLEPSRLSAPEPKSGASANSATRACEGRRHSLSSGPRPQPSAHKAGSGVGLTI